MTLDASRALNITDLFRMTYAFLGEGEAFRLERLGVHAKVEITG